MYDVIIIGGGPAGITAAIYAARKYLKTLLVTKDFEGQIFNSSKVDNYPGFQEISGAELSYALKDHLFKFAQKEKNSKLKIKEGETVNKVLRKGKFFEVKTENKKSFISKTIIIATGASPRKLEVPGAREFEGKGISFCETCDGFFFKDKNVAVLGSGNAGLEAAEELLNYTKNLYIVEAKDEIAGDKLLFEKVRKEGARIIFNAQIKEIKGKDFVEKIVFFDKKQKKEKEIEVDGIFVKIGQKPNTDFLKGFLRLNKKGEIIVNPVTLETSQKGVFAAGDVTDLPFKQYIISAGEGAKALISLYNYLKSL